MSTIKNEIIIALVVIVVFLGFFQYRSCNKINIDEKLMSASKDTLHHNKGTAYISTLVGDKDNLISVLSNKTKQDSLIINDLKKNHNIQSEVVVTSKDSIHYTHKIDTIYKTVNFTDTLKNKWVSANIKVDSGISKWNIKVNDEIVLSNRLKSNGFLKGNILTTYAESLNKDEGITGITSINTIIDKPKLRIVPAVGFGLNTDLHGNNVRFGFNVGIVVTFNK